MLKRLILVMLVLSTFVLMALAPMNMVPSAENTVKVQETIVVTVVVQNPIPLSDSAPVAGIPMSTLLIFGFLIILGVIVVLGGMALMNRPT